MTGRAALFLCASALALAGLAIAQAHSGDVLLYNHSPSLPIGLYWRIDDAPVLSSIVTVRAADVAPEEARQRGFDRSQDRFIKRIAAAAGDVVCARDGLLTINGAVAAQRRATDSSGHALRHWSGCRTLHADEYFLLGDTADSFDGRYWGPVHASQIEGVWRPL